MENTQIVDTKKLNIIVILLSIMAFLTYGDNYAAAPMIVEIAKDLNLPISQAALSVAAYMLPFGLFILVYGPLGDKIGKTKILKTAAFATAVFSALGAAAFNLPSLITIRAINGVFAAGTFPITMALIGDLFGKDPKIFQNTLGRVMGIMFLGGAVAPAIGGTLSYLGSWRLVYLFYGLAELVVAILMIKIIHVQPVITDGPAISKNPYKAAFANGRLMKTVSILLLVGFAALGSFVYTGDHLQSVTGYNILIIGLILSCFGIGTVLGGRRSGTLKEKVGNKVLLIAGVIGAIFWGLMGLWTSTILFCLSLFVFGVAFIMIQPTLVATAQQLVPNQRGMAMSLSAFCMMVGGAIGTLLNGQIINQWGYNVLYIVAAIALMITGLLATMHLNSIKQRR